jgi:hypothetical protein
VIRSANLAVQLTTNFGLSVQGLDAMLPLQISMNIDNLYGSHSVIDPYCATLAGGVIWRGAVRRQVFLAFCR